jgi:hypothetical protein
MASQEENTGNAPPPAGPSAPAPPPARPSVPAPPSGSNAAGKVKEEEVDKDKDMLNQFRWMMEEAVEDGFKREDENRSKKPTEIKIGTPNDYDGNPSTAKQWLNTVVVYIILNKHIYNDDAKRIIFAQSFMKTGPAAAWANALNEEALQLKPNGTRIGWGTWAAFETEFRASFTYGDAKAKALNELQTMRQTGSIEEYIGKFRILAADSGIKEHIALIGYFRVGIKRALMRQIYATEFVPITIEGWYAKAATFESNWKMANAVDDNNPKDSYQKPRYDGYQRNSYQKAGHNSYRPRKINNLEINRTELSKEERDRYFKEALCFECGQKGHRAFSCPQRQGPSRPRFDRSKTNIQTTITEEAPNDKARVNAITIKAMLEGMSGEERTATLEVLGEDVDF